MDRGHRPQAIGHRGRAIARCAFFCFCASLALFPAAAAADDTALLPPDGFGGWKKTGNLRIFKQADLYGYIDGGAELFFEFGFEQLTQQKYRAGGAEFTLDLYRMTDPVAATGVYLMRCGNETRSPAFAERHTVSMYQLMFQRDRYYVVIGNSAASAQRVPDLLRFGSFLSSRMPLGQRVVPLDLLPRRNQVGGSVRLIRGPYALQPIYTLGDGDMLLLGGKLTAVAANYEDPTLGGYTLLAAVYPDPPAARIALQHILSNLDRYLKVVDKGPSHLVFKDYEDKYGSVSLTGARLDLRLHLEKAPGS
jgi:Family of unknown function (DUF6599)